MNSCRRLIDRILTDINQDLKANINVRQGMEILWWDVSETIIASCWKKSDTFSSEIAQSSLEDVSVSEELWEGA